MGKRGAKYSLCFKRIQKLKKELDFKHVTLIGHSNGGDMSMLFAHMYPDLVDKVISLDNRRMPFPRSKQPKIYSIRSSDQIADEGVLPDVTEQAKFGMKIVKLDNVTHDQMDNYANQDQRVEINKWVLNFLESN